MSLKVWNSTGEIPLRIVYESDTIITPFDTIKNVYESEISIDKFLRVIDKGINKHCEFYGDCDIEQPIKYKVNVYKLANGSSTYAVCLFDNNTRYTYDLYRVDAYKHPELAGELEKYAAITDRHEFEKNSYKKIEEGQTATTEENIAYVDYAESQRKHCNSFIRRTYANILSLPISILGIIASLVFFDGNFGLTVILAMFAAFSFAYSFFSFVEGNINHPIARIKQSLLLKRKIKKIRKKLEKSDAHVNEQVKTVKYNNDSNKLYRDHVINYMKSIMQAAEKLNDNNRKQVLHELGDILDNYTYECQQLSDADNRPLTLEGGRRQVVMSTIDSLTTLEMKVADMINNKFTISENAEFREEINNNLATLEEGKKLVRER